jgi:hypothetical protein
MTFGWKPDEFNEEATEEWLQSRGTSFEQLQHFEEPADEQPVTIAAMIFNAVAKADLPIGNQNEAKASLIAACITSGSVTIDTTMTEADFSGRQLGAAGAWILAAFMSTKMFEAKGSLSKLTWSGEQWFNAEAGRMEDAPPVTLDTTMTDADFSNKHLGASGAMILAAFISSRIMKDKGSLSNLNLANNGLAGGGDMSGVAALADALPKWYVAPLLPHSPNFLPTHFCDILDTLDTRDPGQRVVVLHQPPRQFYRSRTSASAAEDQGVHAELADPVWIDDGRDRARSE